MSLTRLAIAGAGAESPSVLVPGQQADVYAPNHHMAVSVKGASRGSGATVTLDGTELGSNGEKPVTTKLTNNAAGTHPPVICPQPPLKGGRRGAPGGSRDGV
jgi:hypothetical protein